MTWLNQGLQHQLQRLRACHAHAQHQHLQQQWCSSSALAPALPSQLGLAVKSPATQPASASLLTSSHAHAQPLHPHQLRKSRSLVLSVQGRWCHAHLPPQAPSFSAQATGQKHASLQDLHQLRQWSSVESLGHPLSPSRTCRMMKTESNASTPPSMPTLTMAQAGHHAQAKTNHQRC